MRVSQPLCVAPFTLVQNIGLDCYVNRSQKSPEEPVEFAHPLR